MSGFSAFLAKELTEIRRTWRIWVIPGMLVFFGISSPLIAAITPAMVQSIAESQPGVVIQLPPPTVMDSFAQFLKALNQFVLIAIVITAAASVSGERSSGTAILVLTKPLSRGAFLAAKMVSQILLLVAATVLGTAACLAITAVVFEGADAIRLMSAVFIWLINAALLVIVMTFFSAAFSSRGAAAGAGLAWYFLTLLLSSWGPAARNAFLGLIPAMRDALLGEPFPSFAVLFGAVLAGAIAIFAAVEVFRRKEL